MADFPYTQVTGKLKSLFQKIQQVGKPETVDKKWLASIGFKSSNDSTLISVLRFIDFIDQTNNPTERWTRYRNKSQSRKVLAEGILIGYAELFQIYPDAYRRSDYELKAFFTTKTTSGSQVISKTVTTFKILCEGADFQDVPIDDYSTQPKQKAQVDPGVPSRHIKEVEAGITININIQLSLPDTTDESVYDNLFAAMKKHLLS